MLSVVPRNVEFWEAAGEVQILLTQVKSGNVSLCRKKAMHSNFPSYFRGVGIHKAVHMYLSPWQTMKGLVSDFDFYVGQFFSDF